MQKSFGRRQYTEINQPLLTDYYHITMAYAYWKSGKTNDEGVFEIYFRKNPFDGEFAVFAGVKDCLEFIESFHYTKDDLDYLRKTLPKVDDEGFYTYLKEVTTKDVKVYAMEEGTVCFPNEPLVRLEGSLIVIQLLEAVLLNMINFASLVATNAARYRLAAGDYIELWDFGLRSSQGANGSLNTSRYSYMGGFDGTTNTLAGKVFKVPLKSIPAHGYVTSFDDVSELPNVALPPKNGGPPMNMTDLSLKWRGELSPIVDADPQNGEFAALISFAVAFPNDFLVCVDTFAAKRYPYQASSSKPLDKYRGGLLNFTAVALALDELGYQPVGIRVDGGDLAHVSKEVKDYFETMSAYCNRGFFKELKIVATGDISEATLHSLNEQNHKIDCFGISTSMVACQRQQTIGGVCKLVELNGRPRIKLNQDIEKVTIPAKKNVFRLYGQDGLALIDLMQTVEELPPQPSQRVLCKHPFEETKRAFVVPTKVEALLKPYWQNGKICQVLPSLEDTRQFIDNNLKAIRGDVKRHLNPTPYKVAVNDVLYNFLHEIWMHNAPIGELD